MAYRYAMSSILHSFCSLESAINEIGKELFWEPASTIYIADKNLLLREFIKSWDKKSVLDKLGVILECKNVQLRPKLMVKLRELNNLRNWIVHGFVYEITLLVEPKLVDGTDPEYQVLDQDYNVKWKQKFSNTKFKPIKELNYKDAKTALVIILDTLKVEVAKTFSRGYTVVTCENGQKIHFLLPKMFDISKLMD
jgi:hypothetical protein